MVSLLLTGIFSFLETSITSLKQFTIRDWEKTSRHYKKLLSLLDQQPQKILITILVACNLANVTCAALATRIMEHIFQRLNLSRGLGFTVGIALASTMILIFGEILPKTFAQIQGKNVFRRMLWLVNAIYSLLYPFVKSLTTMSDFIIGKLTQKTGLAAEEALLSERELRCMIEYVGEKNVLEQEKTQMLQNVLEIGDIPAREIMVPEPDIVSIDSTTTIKNALAVFTKYQFSRLPVYEGKEDNIIGLVYLKDIFIRLSTQQDEKPIVEIIRPILFVPESIKVSLLLKDFKNNHTHMAIILNEHGSIAGLVTLEDVLEEIVGEISDENEPKIDKLIPLSEGGWLVDAGTNLEKLQDLLNITFEAEDAITLGGFLAEQLQHLPIKGERVFYKNYCFQVHKTSKKRVLQVLIFSQQNIPENTIDNQ
jgi:putative hemolysin